MAASSPRLQSAHPPPANSSRATKRNPGSTAVPLAVSQPPISQASPHKPPLAVVPQQAPTAAASAATVELRPSPTNPPSATKSSSSRPPPKQQQEPKPKQPRRSLPPTPSPLLSVQQTPKRQNQGRRLGPPHPALPRGPRVRTTRPSRSQTWLRPRHPLLHPSDHRPTAHCPRLLRRRRHCCRRGIRRRSRLWAGGVSYPGGLPWFGIVTRRRRRGRRTAGVIMGMSWVEVVVGRWGVMCRGWRRRGRVGGVGRLGLEGAGGRGWGGLIRGGLGGNGWEEV